MCEPTTIALVAAGTSAASTVVSAYGNYQQAAANKNTANYNASVAEMEAQDARRRGDENAAQVRRQNAQLAGAQRAAFSAKGIDFSDGSAADAIDQTDVFSQVDQNTARDNAAREAWNARARKKGYEYQAATIRPGFSAASTLLAGASDVAGKWSAYKKVS